MFQHTSIHVPTVSYMCRFYNCAATAAAFLKRPEGQPQRPRLGHPIRALPKGATASPRRGEDWWRGVRS